MLFAFFKVSFTIIWTGQAGRVGPGRASRAGRVGGRVRQVTGRGPGQAGRGVRLLYSDFTNCFNYTIALRFYSYFTTALL